MYVAEADTKRAAAHAVLHAEPEEDPAFEPLDPRTDLANHSPTGFSWGYAGSGPSQLALAIAADLYGDERALEVYQDLKHGLVADADGDARFVATEERVEGAVRC